MTKVSVFTQFFGSKDHAIVPDTVKTTFNLHIESIEKVHTNFNNVG